MRAITINADDLPAAKAGVLVVDQRIEDTWLTVEWESSDVAPVYLGHPMTDSFRAHVLDVVPIVGGFTADTLRPFVFTDGVRTKLLRRDFPPTDITLPPGDHVGRYAVLIGEPLSLAG